MAQHEIVTDICRAKRERFIFYNYMIHNREIIFFPPVNYTRKNSLNYRAFFPLFLFCFLPVTKLLFIVFLGFFRLSVKLMQFRWKCNSRTQDNIAVFTSVFHSYPRFEREWIFGHLKYSCSSWPVSVATVACMARKAEPETLVGAAPIQSMVVPNKDCLLTDKNELISEHMKCRTNLLSSLRSQCHHKQQFLAKSNQHHLLN